MLNPSKLKKDDKGITEYQHSEFRKTLDIFTQCCGPLGESFAVILVDIDHLKGFNERYGYGVGDLLLKKVGETLGGLLRCGDLLYRCGDDEFAVLLKNVTENEVMALSHQIEKAIYEKVSFGWVKEKCRVSIGAALFPTHGEKSRDILKKAELALTRAKQKNQGKAVVYQDVLKLLCENGHPDEESFMMTMKVLLTIIDAKDQYTLGHSTRVAEYSDLLGKQMGLGQENLKILKASALFHDIGKIEIEGELLAKKEQLTAEEMTKIRRHPTLGCDIIKPFEYLNIHEDIILYHHERMDGKGYPYGLRGNEIPLMARVTAIADSFDAMTTNRPYSSKKTIEAALEELKRCGGTQFDPELVEIFCQAIEENEKELNGWEPL